MTLLREDNLRAHRRDMVDAMVSDSPIARGYELVGLSGADEVWSDGVIEFAITDGMKADWQGSNYNYNSLVLGFR